MAERAEEFRQRRCPARRRDDLPPPLRADVGPAQPEGAGHLRLHGHGPGQPRLPALHPAHAGQRAAQPRRGIPSWAALLARAAPATSRSCDDGDGAHRRFPEPRRRGSARPGLAPQQALQRQAPVPDRARRQRLRAGRDGQGRGAGGGLGGRGADGPGVVAGADGPRQGGQARAGRLRGGRHRACRCCRSRTTTRSRPRSTAPRS